MTLCDMATLPANGPFNRSGLTLAFQHTIGSGVIESSDSTPLRGRPHALTRQLVFLLLILEALLRETHTKVGSGCMLPLSIVEIYLNTDRAFKIDT